MDIGRSDVVIGCLLMIYWWIFGLMVYYLVFEVDRDMRSSTCVIFMDLVICSWWLDYRLVVDDLMVE